MRREIGTIAHEEKNPAKIRRALGQDCGGVIVESAVPAEVVREWQAVAGSTLSPVIKDSPLIIADGTAPGHCRWKHEDEAYAETQRWLMEEFEWASSSNLCRRPENAQGHDGMLRLWTNGVMHLPWHIDFALSEIFPDIHIHIAGAGMKVAAPAKAIHMTFSDRKGTPYLELPDLSWRNILHDDAEYDDAESDDTRKTIGEKLEAYMRERDVSLLKLKPGQMLFFNEKCLHASARENQPRLRAAIF